METVLNAMKGYLETGKGYIDEVTAKFKKGDFSSRECVLLGVILFLLGLVIGMLISPRKTQVFGSYNGSNNGVGSEEGCCGQCLEKDEDDEDKE